MIYIFIFLLILFIILYPSAFNETKIRKIDSFAPREPENEPEKRNVKFNKKTSVRVIKNGNPIDFSGNINDTRAWTKV